VIIAVGLADHEAGNLAIQILGSTDEILLQLLRRDGGDGLRRLLQGLVLLLTHHHDAFKLIRRVGRRAGEREQDDGAGNPRYPLHHDAVHCFTP